MTTDLQLIAAGVAGAMASGAVRPLLAPFDAVHDVWADLVRERIERTRARAIRKNRDPGACVSERTAVNALAAAALTDDLVVQEYLAGVIASASPADDNVHLLALINRLTPLQLRLHYGCYLAVTELARQRFDSTGSQRDVVWEAANEMASTSQFVVLASDAGLPRGDDSDRLERALDHLAREGLLGRIASYWDESEQTIVAFELTEFGMELFAAALALPYIGFGDFCEVDHHRLLLDPPIAPMAAFLHLDFVAAYNNDSPGQTWSRVVGQQ